VPGDTNPPTIDRAHRPAHDAAASDERSWTFLTNHAHVLIAISRNPELRQRDISGLVGITEGAVQRILHELEDDGYVERERVGRRNRYAVIGNRPLRHQLEAGHTIEEIIETVNRTTSTAR
jgi:predicted transcriptional regulator